MKKYFYTDGTEKFGPFTLEELQAKSITPTTLVWYEGLADWQEARSVIEVQTLFQEKNLNTAPQPLTNPALSIQSHKNDNIIEKLAFIAIIYWFFTDFIRFMLNTFSEGANMYFHILSNVIFSAVPIILALTLKDPRYKTVGIILAICVALVMLYNNLQWFAQSI